MGVHRPVGLELDSHNEAVATVEELVPTDGDGSLVMPLAEAAATHPDLLREWLGAIVPAADVRRNEARWRDGLLVHVRVGRASSSREATVAGAAGEEIEWRVLVVLEDGAEAEVWERYASEPGGAALFNGVVELVVGDRANLRYVCEQELSGEAGSCPQRRVRTRRDHRMGRPRLRVGARQVRMETKLAGRGSSAKVTGAYAGMGRQHLDYDTTQEHAGQDTVSDLAFRGVLAEQATAVWRGMIRVDPGAQPHRRLPGEPPACSSRPCPRRRDPGAPRSRPVTSRCTHAAAVAQVDAEQLYYLRAHGLSEPEAKQLVIEGFLQELVERAQEAPIREALRDALGARLERLLASA